jgi:hypothetical protein
MMALPTLAVLGALVGLVSADFPDCINGPVSITTSMLLRY